MADNVSMPEMTGVTSARTAARWEGWKNRDAASDNAIFADHFNH
jgi:hypothetical protein